MECLKNRGSWGWGGAGSKLVEFEVVEYLGDRGSLCPVQECICGLANMGEGRV